MKHMRLAVALLGSALMFSPAALAHGTLVLGPNINAPMDPEAVGLAARALARAHGAMGDTEPREKALIAALAERYSADPDADRTGLNLAYANAMAQVAARFPQDPTIQANRDAVAADESYLAAVTPPEGSYTYSYYRHNLHFLLESARMAGDADTAIAAAEKLPKVMSREVSVAIPWVQLIEATPYFAHAQFSAPETTLRLPDPGDRLPYLKAMWRYARGVAYAARRDLEAARLEADTIVAIAGKQDFSGMIDGGVPAPQLLKIAELVIHGRVAQARGDYPEAATAFREAVAIQDDLPYLEPPFWYYPVRQPLGAALLLQERPDKAEREFRQALEQFPNNAWALFGLREALNAQGDASAVSEVDKRLSHAWVGTREELSLSRL